MLQKQQTAYKSASVTCSPTHRVSPALFGMPVPAHTLQIPALPSLGWNIMASTIISSCVHVCAQSPSRVQLRSHMDSRPPGFSVHGIFQGRILEWVAISFSKGIFPTQGLNPCLLQFQHKQVDSLLLSHLMLLLLSRFSRVRLCATP